MSSTCNIFWLCNSQVWLHHYRSKHFIFIQDFLFSHGFEHLSQWLGFFSGLENVRLGFDWHFKTPKLFLMNCCECDIFLKPYLFEITMNRSGSLLTTKQSWRNVNSWFTRVSSLQQWNSWGKTRWKLGILLKTNSSMPWFSLWIMVACTFLVVEVIFHDLIHAFDDCRAENLNWTNCVHHVCSEIRVNRLSGDCHFKRELLRGILKIPDTN